MHKVYGLQELELSIIEAFILRTCISTTSTFVFQKFTHEVFNKSKRGKSVNEVKPVAN